MSQLTKSATFYLVHALDAPEKEALRAQVSPDHRQYMETLRHQLLIGGPLLDDAGVKRIGSAFVIQADSREQVEALVKQEPYNMAGVFESVTIRLFQSVMFEPTLLQGV